MQMSVILHPTDGSESAKKALDFACDLAKDRGARLIILHAQREAGSNLVPKELKHFEKIEHQHLTEADLFAQTSREILHIAEDHARTKGVEEVETLNGIGDPTRMIVDTVKEKQADLIVIGSRGLGDLQGLLLGSVSHKVAHAAPCSCLIVR